MSLKKVIAAALCTLITATALVSCVENDRTMGEGMLPGETILTVGVKSLDLPVANRISDSLQATNQVKMLVGTMTDPVYGRVVCNAASYILPYSDTTDFGENPELISAYISLSIDSTFYLDQSQEGIHQRIKIHKLKSRLNDTLSFCNSITPDDYYPETITTSDPLIYGIGEIRIDLKEEFAQELLSLTKEDFEDLDLFQEKIPGFYMEVEEPLGNSEGGRMNDIRLGNSTIILNYTYNDPENGISKDTTESFAFGYSTAFNFFSTSSSHLANENPGDTLYLEGLSGVKPYVSAATLRDMIDSWIQEDQLENYTIIISRAEVVLPYEMPADFDRFDKEHPTSVYAFSCVPWATDTSRYMLPLPELLETNNRGEINRSLREYSLDITEYVQQLMLTDKAEIDGSMDLWFCPLTYRSNIAGDTYYELDNYNYRKIFLNGPTQERRPVINITYGLMENL